MILKIIKDENHPILHKRTRPAEKVDGAVKRLIEDMKETLKNQANPEGVGLSANQVGYDLNLAVIRLPLKKTPDQPAQAHADEYMVLLNPKIVSFSESKVEEIEGCLSVPHQWGKVGRSESVSVEAQGLDGKTFMVTAKNFLARILQHEIDHLRGTLFKEKVVGKILNEEELENELQRNPKS